MPKPEDQRELNSTEAVLAFAGYLSSLDTTIFCGSAHTTKDLVKVTKTFIEENDLPEPNEDFETLLIYPGRIMDKVRTKEQKELRKELDDVKEIRSNINELLSYNTDHEKRQKKMISDMGPSHPTLGAATTVLIKIENTVKALDQYKSIINAKIISLQSELEDSKQKEKLKI